MRKNAGFFIMALLLLAVPALANAWTLTVKVAGGTDANNVTVTYGTVSKTFKSSVSYMYPTSAVSIVDNGAATAMTLDGVATTPATFVSPTSGSHTLSVTYGTTLATSGLSLTQVDGGVVYAMNKNNTWTSVGVTGLVAGTMIPVSIAADANHSIVGYKLDGGATVPAGTGVAGEVATLSLPAGSSTLTPVFAMAAKVSAALFAPTNGVSGTAINLSVTATTNDTGLQYSFSVNGVATAASATNTYSFTPAAAGNYTVAATVTSANGGSFTTDAVVIAVADAQTTANQGCVSCHATQPALHSYDLKPAVTCQGCHSQTPHVTGTSCKGCHAIEQTNPFAAGPALVADNANNLGVRAVVGEFKKWSHHIVNPDGLEVQDAQCAVCHLEGTVVENVLKVDATKHMADAIVHLRNADTDADMQWDPAAPNHSTMDAFCMSCHDANGATSPINLGLQKIITPLTGKTATPGNPFGDTISNRYDKMQRPAVTNVDSQFDTANNSHHAVKGPRYSGRTRAAGARQIASPTTFAQNSSAILKGKRSTMFDAGVMNQLYVPLENAAGEVAPRTGSATLGDDSTLHCGDCHTVGQWKPGSSVNRLGQPTTAAIGAHGSNNEYLLRNTLGTDERHTQNSYTLTGGIVTFTNPNGAFLVCYNCHAYAAYGSVFNATGGGQTNGATGPHAGEYDQAGRCDGVGNTIPFNGYTTGTATDGTQFASRFEGPVSKYGATPAFAPGFPLNGTAPTTGQQDPDFGNIFGIQCLNCHNSGLGNAYGGIHGSANNTNTKTQTVNPAVTGGAYIDGMGNTTKVERFLPGLGNAMHVPGTLGGVIGGTSVTPAGATYSIYTGGISNDTNWEQKHWQQTASTTFGATGATAGGTLAATGAGCYTLSESATAATSALEGPSVTGPAGAATEVIGTWGGCDDHGADQGKGDHGFFKRIVRPVTY